MADTGCQSCLAVIKVIHRLGINQNELIPVNMKMHAANNKGFTILGATILRICGKDDQGRHVETRQMTNVTDNFDKLFISREACIALRMISDSCPTIGEINETQQPIKTSQTILEVLMAYLPLVTAQNRRNLLHCLRSCYIQHLKPTSQN